MNQRELLRAANVLAALRAIVRECRGPDKPFSTDSYLPPHLLDLAVAALDSAETQEHETPLQVIKSVLLDDAERAPSAPAGELELNDEEIAELMRANGFPLTKCSAAYLSFARAVEARTPRKAASYRSPEDEKAIDIINKAAAAFAARPCWYCGATQSEDCQKPFADVLCRRAPAAPASEPALVKTWQHDETGRTCRLERSPGPRWAEVPNSQAGEPAENARPASAPDAEIRRSNFEQSLERECAAPAGEPDDFDKWQANPYTKVLQKSIAEDYEPKHRAAAPAGEPTFTFDALKAAIQADRDYERQWQAIAAPNIDAQRYRWLRDESNDCEWPDGGDWILLGEAEGVNFDAIVDAAMERVGTAAPANELATSEALAPLKAANLSAALRSIVRECQDPKRFTSYLPPHLLDLAVAALESTETQEHETPLQVIESVLRGDIERAPSYEELRERNREKRL